jgi:hypothetical protein
MILETNVCHFGKMQIDENYKLPQQLSHKIWRVRMQVAI